MHNLSLIYVFFSLTEACEIVRLFVNKLVVSSESRRRGNPSYGCLKALRVLVLSSLTGLENDPRIVEHFKKHRWLLEPWAYQAYLIERLLEGGGGATSACWRRFLNGSPISSDSQRRPVT